MCNRDQGDIKGIVEIRQLATRLKSSACDGSLSHRQIAPWDIAGMYPSAGQIIDSASHLQFLRYYYPAKNKKEEKKRKKEKGKKLGVSPAYYQFCAEHLTRKFMPNAANQNDGPMAPSCVHEGANSHLTPQSALCFTSSWYCSISSSELSWHTRI